MPTKDITPDEYDMRERVKEALLSDDVEGAIETVLEEHPDYTRDQAVDVVDDVESDIKRELEEG